MKRNQFMSQLKILPIIWLVILLGSIYLLVRFAALSFSDDIGQASGSIKEAFMTNLCRKVFESGSSFLSFTSNDAEKDYSFPVSLVAKGFILHDFIKDNSPQTAMARENSISLSGDYPSNPFEQRDATNLGEEDNVEVFGDEEVTNKEDTSSKQTMGIYDLSDGNLSKAYILTNGAMFGSFDGTDGLMTGTDKDGNTEVTYLDQLQIGILKSGIESSQTEDLSDNKNAVVEAVTTDARTNFTLEKLKNVNFLINNFYIVDPETKVSESLFNSETMLSKDMTIKQSNDAPQILIYHTHSQEAFIDSRQNTEEDTVVGIGSYLTEILEEQYGYNVIHDKTSYDIVNGELDRNKAYNYARTGIEKILKDNPTIEVIIDLHRDGVDKEAYKRIITVNQEDTAQIMLYNGLCRDQNGPLTRLENPNLEDNLSFSLQLQLKSLKLYPGLFYKNYLHAYRYNLDVKPKSILMELGTNFNTVQSEKNAMKPFAEILDSVLQGNKD